MFLMISQMRLFCILIVCFAAGPVLADCVTEDFARGDWSVKQKLHQQQDRKADHFALVLSWSPGFCAWQQKKYKNLPQRLQFQCQSGNDFGWILHGLWGQSEGGIRAGNDGSHPAWCGNRDLPDLSRDDLLPFACMSPGARLLQHEWEKHGVCDFTSADQYFSTAKKLYDALVLPNRFVKGQAMLDWLDTQNPALSTTRQSWLGNGREVAICYDRDFHLIDCP